MKVFMLAMKVFVEAVDMESVMRRATDS